jgi:hypothetical protein
MFLAIRKHLTYANVTVTLALLFAMSGGAYAASKYIIVSTKQIKPSVLKQIAGKPGPAGPEGKAGPAGPGGPAGKEGPPGKEGGVGKEGTVGKEGPLGPLGKEGKEGKEGLEGQLGKEGQPWTPNNTLPSKATEKGAWAAAGMPANFPSSKKEGLYAPVSFTIPLKEGLQGSFTEPENSSVHVVPLGGKGEGKFETGVAGKDGLYTGCPTTGEVNKPEAEPGNLCIFISTLNNVGSIFSGTIAAIIPTDPEGLLGEPASGATGSVLWLWAETVEKSMYARGTWAVTAK